jgi:hypothetical protein
MEIVRQKNVSTYVVFPIMKNDGTLITSAAGLDAELDYWDDGNAPQSSFTNTSNATTEIGSTGQYYILLSASELNHDYIIIQVKSSTSGAVTQTLIIRTMLGDPLNMAITTSGGTITLSSGTVTIGSNLDKTGYTASTVSDKTGYTVSTVSDKTGYSLAASQVFNMTGDITGNVTGTVGTVTIVADKTGYSLLATTSTTAIADAVWDEAIAGHTGAGSTGEALNNASSAGNPWATDISSGYTGQAGEVLRLIGKNTDMIR